MNLEELKDYVDVEGGVLKITASKDWGDKGGVSFELRYNLVDVLRIAASKSENTVDDMLVEMVAKALEPGE